MSKSVTPLSREVLAEIEVFLAKTGMRHTKFGMLVVGDPSFVQRVRKGRELRSDTIDSVRRVIAEQSAVRPRRAAGNEGRAAA